MTPSPGRRVGLGALSVALIALIAAGCSKETTAPAPQGRVSATVALEGGGPAAGLSVSLIGFGTPIPSLRIAQTDAGGQASFSDLVPGGYVVYCRDYSSRADAETAFVPAAAPQTASVALVLRPAGKFTGTATLSGRTDHRGTYVYVPVLLPVGLTDSAGRFEVADIPPGQWPVEASHTGYATAAAAVTVPGPGDSVEIAPLQLAPGAPAAPLRRSGRR
jgi:hypothetical protein